MMGGPRGDRRYTHHAPVGLGSGLSGFGFGFGFGGSRSGVRPGVGRVFPTTPPLGLGGGPGQSRTCIAQRTSRRHISPIPKKSAILPG